MKANIGSTLRFALLHQFKKASSYQFFKAGRAFYGIGIACIGIQQFIYRDFRPMILPGWPLWIHASSFWAYLAGAALVIAGTLIFSGKQMRVVSLLLGGFLLVLFIGFQVPYLLFIGPHSPRHLGLWTDPLKELALSGGAFVMAGFFRDQSNSSGNPYLIMLLEKFIPLGRVFFSITMIAFGINHFLYTEFVSTLVPSWIAGHIFWTYFTAVALIGSGIAIFFKIRLKQTGLLLGTMLFLWVILLHIPRAVADPHVASGNEITSVFQALAFCGIALVISGTHKKNQPD